MVGTVYSNVVLALAVPCFGSGLWLGSFCFTLPAEVKQDTRDSTLVLRSCGLNSPTT